MSEKAETTLLEKLLFNNPDTQALALLDGASVPELPQVLWKERPEHVCLWRGELKPDMAATAPYLVKLKQDHTFTRRVFTEGWEKHWGIFALAPVELNIPKLRHHFRTFLMVKDPEGKQLYFRYYDPRVMRLYLPTCNEEELKTIFGPTQSYIMEDETEDACLQFVLADKQLQIERTSLNSPY